ncbi:hypothetical protein AVEN_158821-1 [Araneus ventricosus]|uniref:Uncharacterized protein n=1 Tax=Araneus ventricosus TaxID=182803 RepID=A0A4Y2T3L8_ARAVE|nr:hypothetical protein AVEN_158821-1 [Araneus ventricosus]
MSIHIRLRINDSWTHSIEFKSASGGVALTLSYHPIKALYSRYYASGSWTGICKLIESLTSKKGHDRLGEHLQPISIYGSALFEIRQNLRISTFLTVSHFVRLQRTILYFSELIHS